MRRILNVMLPSACAVSILWVVAMFWWFGRSDPHLGAIAEYSFIVGVIVLYAIVYVALDAMYRKDDPEEWKHFDVGYPEAVDGLEGLLTAQHISHTMSPVDEQWFGDEQRRMGIDRAVLGFHGYEATVFELNSGAQRVMVSNCPGRGMRRSFVSIWVSSKEHLQLLEPLEEAIDAALLAHPS